MPPTHERVLTGRPDLAAAERRLAASLPLRAARARTLDRVLLDTFDGRLRRAELTAERPATGRAPAPSADVWEAAGIRAPLPVARVRSSVTELGVLDDAGKTTVRLTIERRSCSPRTARAPRSRPACACGPCAATTPSSLPR